MKKLNNKTLIIILVALVGIFVLVRLFRAPALESNLKKELVAVDTSKITTIKLFPKSANGEEILLERGSMRWTLKKDDKQYNLEQGTASNLLGYVVKMVPQKMATRKKEKWSEYQVGDSATRVQMLADGKVVADLRFGRLGFNQADIQRMQQQQQYGGGGGFNGAFTYVRVEGEDEVYTVDGFLESSFNRSLNDLRNKALLRVKKDLVTKVSFDYPDSGFVVEKKDKKWYLGSDLADSTKINSYLSQLGYLNASTFADDFNPNGQPTLTVSLEGANGSVATVQAWKREKDWVVTSTHQSGIFFSTEGSGVYNTVFERKKNLSLSKK